MVSDSTAGEEAATHQQAVSENGSTSRTSDLHGSAQRRKVRRLSVPRSVVGPEQSPAQLPVSNQSHVSVQHRSTLPNSAIPGRGSFNTIPLEAMLPGSSRIVLAMPGSAPMETTDSTDGKRRSTLRQPGDSLLSQTVSDLIQVVHPIFLTFKDCITEEMYIQDFKANFDARNMRIFAIVTLLIKIAGVIDAREAFSHGADKHHQHVPIAAVLELVGVSLCTLFAVVVVLAYSKSWIEKVSYWTFIVLLLVESVATGLTETPWVGALVMLPYCVISTNPILLPFQFKLVVAFPAVSLVGFLIGFITSSSSTESTHSHSTTMHTGPWLSTTSSMAVYGVTVLIFRYSEIQSRDLYLKKRCQERLKQRNNSLKAKIELDRGMAEQSGGARTLLEGVVQNLAILETDLVGTGNSGAARVVGSLAHELATSGHNLYAPKLLQVSGLYGTAHEETGGYLDLMLTRHGYGQSRSRSSAPRSLNFSNDSSEQTVGNEPYRRSHNLAKGSSKAASSHSSIETNRRATTAAVVQHSSESHQKPNQAVGSWPLDLNQFSKQIPELGERMQDWSFGKGGIFDPPQECVGHELVAVMQYCFAYYGMFSRLQVVPSIFYRYMSTIEMLYRPISYHNRYHAADVVHSVFWFLAKAEVDRKDDITVNTIFSMLVGAAVHDVAHPGQGNSYHVNMANQYALHFNDIHVLENMHLFTAFDIMRDPKMNIMVNFDLSDRKEIRQYIIDAVIGTDLAMHFENLAKFKTTIESGTMDLANPTHAAELVSILLHAADIASPAKEWTVYRIWIDRVFHEFLLQGDLELQNDIVPAPLMNREVSVPPKAQLGFINFIVSPLFEALISFSPNFQKQIDHLKQNAEHLSKWEAEFDRNYCYTLKNRQDLLPPQYNSESKPVHSISIKRAESNLRMDDTEETIHSYHSSERLKHDAARIHSLPQVINITD